MSKAKLFIEVEIDIDKSNPNDKSLKLHEIADHATNGFVYSVLNIAEENGRKTKVTAARYEYTISQKIH